MGTKSVDYALYLVTGRDLLPPGKDYLETLEEALKGGVTLVQVREKTADTGEILDVARKTAEVCKRYGVPVIIDDRIDIALAMGADGVHLGQTDMPVPIARALLPPGSIIGKTCNTPEHVRVAVAEGADYVGLGPVWGTQTKKVSSPVVGPKGIGEMLEVLDGTDVKAVAIAGINAKNVLHCLWGSVSRTGHMLEGVAVVSDIMASSDPYKSSRQLASQIRAFYASSQHLTFSSTPAEPSQLTPYTPDTIKQFAAQCLSAIKKHTPLVHQITNNVVTTQSANATLALGASPIMATAPEEMEDLSKVSGGLLVNFGTIQNLDGMLAAGRNANINRKPVVFDPVGVGATRFRKESAVNLLAAWQTTVIKGNAGELAAIADSTEVAARGVDSIGRGFADPAKFVRELAKKYRCVVVLTGITDYISDGHTVIKLSNGHALLGSITGSGCMVGTAVATFCAAANMSARSDPAWACLGDDGRPVKGDMLLAAAAGVLAITVASEIAATRSDVQGSGTFLPAFIDALGALSEKSVLERANVEVVA